MSNYYSKYLKYKYKYQELKQQLGGNPELNKLYSDSLAKCIEYVERKRTEGKKIMLIINANPSNQSKFIIPPNHVTVYLQQRISPDSNDLVTFSRSKTESFDSYPVFFGDIANLTDPKFDVIIFNKDTCGLIKFNNKSLTNLFNLTFDNQSVIVLDREKIQLLPSSNSVSILPKIEAESIFRMITISADLPVYTYTIDPRLIINRLKTWFNTYLPGKLNYVENALEANNKFIKLCDFNMLLKNQITSGTKNTVIFYNNNLFYKDNSVISASFQSNLQARGIITNYLYMYFVNTKK